VTHVLTPQYRLIIWNWYLIPYKCSRFKKEDRWKRSAKRQTTGCNQ